ncbi:MAG: bile acid:sodium symporter [Planctomycetota bacterium]
MKFLRKNLFIAMLLITMVVGYFLAQDLEWFASRSWLKWLIVVVTLFVMALPIEFSALRKAVSRPMAAIIACLVSYLFIPLLMWPLSRLAGPVLGPGLIMVAAVPVTLASAAVWTRRAGGDDSIALLVTIITNSICFLMTPLWMYWISGLSIERELLTGTIVNLFLFVVLPMAAAQILRAVHKPIGVAATFHKSKLSVIAQAGVLAMILIGAVKTSLRMADGETVITAAGILITIGVASVVHLSALAFGIFCARATGLARDRQIAVGIAGSQKTLMIGLSAATSLGVTIIPLVVYQVFQLTVDTFIADRWRMRSEEQRTESPSPEEVANLVDTNPD